MAMSVAPQGVSRTALLLAALRVEEGERADRLVDDPLAPAFLAAAAVGGGDTPTAAVLPPGASAFLALRTRYWDDAILAACATGIRQVVLLGAGLDARAFRLPWPPGVRLFEVDLPELFGFKEPVIAAAGIEPRCARVVVPADLREDWTGPLVDAGFDRTAATGWLAEGVLPYLDRAGSDRFRTAVTGLSAPGSHLAFDHLDGTAVDRPAMRATSTAIRQTSGAQLSTMDDPGGWLAACGWQARTARVPDVAEGYGRPLPEDADMVASRATTLTTATR
jgi:methyltransferase (TIGR00027 family)